MTRLFQKGIALFRLLFHKSADPDTETGRARERQRRILLTAFSSVFAKFITIGVSFISIPLTLHYLGSERFGLWMTISSIIAMMEFADLGIGNGLLNAVSKAHGLNDFMLMRSSITGAFFLLSSIAMVILALFFSIYHLVDWASFFNVNDSLAAAESGPSVALFVLCFALGIPLMIVQKVQLGLQLGFFARLWQSLGGVFGLVALLFVIHFEGGLPWLVVAISGSPLIVALINTTVFFGFQKTEILPRFADLAGSGSSMKSIAHLGGLFLVLQLASSVAFSSDNYIISRILGVERVAEYAIVSKLFESAMMVMGMFISPLWPAFGEAKARGDVAWIRSTLKKALRLTLLMGCCVAAVLIVFGPWIIEMWIGKRLEVPFVLIFLYGIWIILKLTGVTLAAFLNGMNIVSLQVIISLIFAVTVIAAKIGLIHIYGVPGVPAALIGVYFVSVLLPYFLLMPRLFRELKL